VVVASAMSTVNQQNRLGKTPLMVAASTGNIPLMTALLEKGAGWVWAKLSFRGGLLVVHYPRCPHVDTFECVRVHACPFCSDGRRLRWDSSVGF